MWAFGEDGARKGVDLPCEQKTLISSSFHWRPDAVSGREKNKQCWEGSGSLQLPLNHLCNKYINSLKFNLLFQQKYTTLNIR